MAFLPRAVGAVAPPPCVVYWGRWAGRLRRLCVGATRVRCLPRGYAMSVSRDGRPEGFPRWCSAGENGAAIVAENASKLFLDGAVVAFHQLDLAVRAAGDPVHRRPERLRQDHAAALHRRPDRPAAAGALAGRRQAGRRPARRRRHGVPAFRPAAVEDRVRQRRLRARDGGRAERRDQGARRRTISIWSGSPASSSTIPISSPAACSSASAWCARSPSIRRSC